MENRTRRQEAFENSIFRELSQFERVEGEIAAQNRDFLDADIAQVLHRAASITRRRGRPLGVGV